MAYTKNLEKNSQNRQSDFTWLYILLFSLLAILVGIGVYWWYDGSLSSRLKHYEYSIYLGDRKGNPTKEEFGSLLANTRNVEKSIEGALNSKSNRKKLTDREKEKARRKLAIICRKRSEILKNVDFKQISKQTLANLFSQIYEQGKLLVELKEGIIEPMSSEEIKKQIDEQERWVISHSEEEEIEREMNKWITKWYNKFMEEELRPEKNEKKLTEYVIPTLIDGQKITNPSRSEIAKFKKVWSWTVEHENGLEEKKYTDFGQPLYVKFNGYGGFLNEQDKKTSHENSTVLGVTSAPGLMSFKSRDENNEFKCFAENTREIIIRLRKENFFNRLGYDTWIRGINQEGRASTIEIYFEQVVETIAHELAHAIVSSMHGEYLGEYDEGGGHGTIHDDIEERVEEMMKNGTDFPEFEKWWNKSK